MIKDEKDADLALIVSNSLVASLREYYIKKSELKVAEVGVIFLYTTSQIKRTKNKNCNFLKYASYI